jgi:hypothetical protein
MRDDTEEDDELEEDVPDTAEYRQQLEELRHKIVTCPSSTL